MDVASDAVPIAELLDERRHLLDVAHRMSGGRRDTESVIDETYRRWYGLSGAERARIVSPRAWLSATAGDICRGLPAAPGREGGAGPGVPSAGYDHELTAVARRRLLAQRSGQSPSPEHDAVVRAVGDACAAGDAASLSSALSPDAMAVFDGGGKVRTTLRSVHGGEQVTRSLLTLLGPHPRTTLTAQSVNSRTGLVVRCDHTVAAVISLDVTDRRVAQVWAVLNPDKLRRWNQRAHATGAFTPES
ncbi:RNA polymerase subunit sigma [Actinacidiphila glaucinigra]|uniref:RNA polymerase subunit sigma n=1 Tax=Actinacidiphila glaucinigra TaxID=235986 RepID=UPI002DD9B73A|nr:RNA polymerase subunit sigma [Actinacidiphila glaucinigra]WSD58031.1 RNA polymerase subunit sigma [Actinacidiphila glaucinigra]